MQGAGETAHVLHAPGAQGLGEHGAPQHENSLASLAPRLGAAGAQSPHGGLAHANHPAPAVSIHDPSQLKSSPFSDRV